MTCPKCKAMVFHLWDEVKCLHCGWFEGSTLDRTVVPDVMSARDAASIIGISISAMHQRLRRGLVPDACMKDDVWQVPGAYVLARLGRGRERIAAARSAP